MNETGRHARMTPEAAVEHPRRLRRVEPVTASADGLRVVCDDLAAARPLGETAARLGRPDTEVLDAAVEFGMHRARVLKRNMPKVPAKAWHEHGMLFPPTWDEQVHRAVRTHRIPRCTTRRRTDKTAELCDGCRTGTACQTQEAAARLAADLVLPHGYDRDACGKDVANAIRALIVLPVSDADIARFVSRQAPPTTTMDSYHVSAVRWVCHHGKAHKLAELGDADYHLGQLLVAAYDLLEVARADAMRAVEAITTGQVDGLSGLRSAITRARWLAPYELNRLDQLVTAAERNPGERMTEMLRVKLANFVRWVAGSPALFRVDSVAELTQAHLVQILTTSGLISDEVEEKEIRAELATRLADMGLGADLDREVNEGVRAWRRGKLAEFYASRQARADGDPDWTSAYAEVLAALEEAEQAFRTDSLAVTG